MNCEHCNGPIPEVKNKGARFCSVSCRRKKYAQKMFPEGARFGINKASTGAISEMVVCADLLKMGFSVFRSISAACDCDIIAMKDGRIIRVEVKTAYKLPSGSILCPKKKSQAGKHDVLAMVFLRENSITYKPDGVIQACPTPENVS